VPDADIILEAIKELRKRTRAGAATFLVKAKAHQGEPGDLQIQKLTSKQTRLFQAKMLPQTLMMARQDKSSSRHMTRASPERRYGEL